MELAGCPLVDVEMMNTPHSLARRKLLAHEEGGDLQGSFNKWVENIGLQPIFPVSSILSACHPISTCLFPDLWYKQSRGGLRYEFPNIHQSHLNLVLKENLRG